VTGCEDSRINTDDIDTEDVVRRYVAAWTGGDVDAVRALLAEGATAESNLPGPFLETLPVLAAQARLAPVSETITAGRAALVYDCVTPGGPIRVAEFLTVADGRITDVRRVYDVVALRAALPALAG
jgi:ketosteroid isomerase-like protein